MDIDKNKRTLFNSTSAKNWRDWHWQFKNRITRVKTFESYGFSAEALESLNKVNSVYPIAITPYYSSLIEPENVYDPIKAQCFPDVREISPTPQAQSDPLEEDSHMPVPKLVHRYPDRCLAIVTEICATYCRHCNRKRYWRAKPLVSLKKRLAEMIRYISQTPQIREVIISGGDPLTFDDHALENLLSSLHSIPHVEILRIGSRAPVVMPMRINKELCKMLNHFRPLWFNTQFNHPREITPESARACNMLQDAGIPVSNQAVLLKGVNDSAETMKNLQYGLQKISVRPYYLFHCDPVSGCEHFRTDINEGIKIIETISRHCSGLSLPQYVLDVPGSTGKIPLNALSGEIQKDLQKHQHFFDKLKQID